MNRRRYFMELKLTTKRALEYEKRTGQDVLDTVMEIAETGRVKVKDVVELFEAMGENYTVEVFEAWDVPFVEKATKVIEAVTAYTQGNVPAGK